ncbi:hypothetical protein [Providencia heimbachae]|uniref:hypothetical protein n=1 Tax=Providencia heimbachae TaxID=333962 RepID=UPI0008393447|nr:hypothetical protein [Providencia heimbachae]NIH22157.1 hypothetical protein [Providencia heimbachae]
MSSTNKGFFLFLGFIFVIVMVCIYARQLYEWVMSITGSNTIASIFLILIVPYILISLALLYFMRKYEKLSEVINNLSEKALPVTFSSATVFFAIATVLGVNTSNLDLTFTSVLTFVISNNPFIGTIYITLLIFLLSLITAAKWAPLTKPMKTEDAKKVD